MYLFVNAMTTVSAVVFLYSPETTLAAIAVLNMDDAGDVAPAAAMAMTDPRHLDRRAGCSIRCRAQRACWPARRPGGMPLIRSTR